MSLLTNKQSIGYKWLEKFNQVTARYVRLKITKGQACVALNIFGIYKKQFVKPLPLVGIAAPAVRHVATQSVAIPIFGRFVKLPSSFAGKTFTAELLDLSGRILRGKSVFQVALYATSLLTGAAIFLCLLPNLLV
jgi:hypothetical protein